MSQQPPDKPSPLLDSQNVPLPKPEQANKSVKREIDHIARQLEGLSHRLKRLKEAT